MADDPRATIVMTGLNEYLYKPGRKERLEPQRAITAVRDAQGNITGQEPGEALPREQQAVLGQVLINLLSTMKTEGLTPGKLRLIGKLIDRLEEAVDGDGSYEAGEMALGLLREAARSNGMGYRPYLLAQVWEAIGTGESGSEEV